MRRLIFGFLAVLGALSPIGQLRAESPNNLNELFVHQWVQATDKGEIVGTVTEPQANDAQKLEKVKIAIVQDGKILHVGESDASGKFAISGVKPGSYSLIARGEKTLAAFSLQVLGPEAGKHLTNEVDVRCIRPAGEKVIDIVRSQIVPPYLTRFDSATNTMVDPLGDARKFAETHLVVADENGAMMGNSERRCYPRSMTSAI